MKKIQYLSILLTLFALPLSAQVLTVEGGQIEGVPSDAPGVTVYKGIPYAAPPVGGLRGIIGTKSQADAEAAGQGMWDESGCKRSKGCRPPTSTASSATCPARICPRHEADLAT